MNWSKYPGDLAYNFPLSNLSILLLDTLGLPFYSNATISLTSDEIEESKRIFPNKIGDYYHFSNLPHQTYKLTFRYKGTSHTRTITLSKDTVLSEKFSFEYTTDFKTYDIHGFPIDSVVHLFRENIALEAGSIPPGNYMVNISIIGRNGVPIRFLGKIRNFLNNW